MQMKVLRNGWSILRNKANVYNCRKLDRWLKQQLIDGINGELMITDIIQELPTVRKLVMLLVNRCSVRQRVEMQKA